MKARIMPENRLARLAALALLGSVVLPAAPALADTVCFKQNTELDFINKTDMANSRAKLENGNYFGPGGAAAPESFDFAALATVSEATLVASSCDIFIGGGFEGSLSAAEGTELVNWSQGPRDVVVIGGCDLDTSNQTCLAFGRTLTDIPNGGVSVNETLAYNPLTCGGAGGIETFGGRSTYIGTGPSGTDIPLARHNTAGLEPAVSTDSINDPKIIMTADADMFGSSGSASIGAGPIAATDQSIFLLNVFKFALDGIHGRLDNPQCVDSYENRTDLELALTAPTPTVSIGQQTVVTVQVANVAGFNVDDVRAQAAIPAGFGFVSASGPGSYDSGTGVWDIGSIPLGQSRSLAITLEATGPGSVSMQAEITRSSLTDGDSAANESFGVDDLGDGINDDDEATLALTVPPVDRSDAPVGGEALHEIVAGIFLGAGAPDSDTLAQSNASATADDLDGGDDDDGVTFPSLTPGGSGVITVTASGAGFLQAWIDWNGDGTFDALDQIATDLRDVDGDGTIPVPVTVPPGATTAQTFARFRWSSDFTLGATGAAADGEVEDYALTFAGTGPGLSGQVLLDNGAGGGTAHDAALSGTETGIVAATVGLYDSGGSLIAAPALDAAGRWSYVLPAGYAGSLTVLAAPAPGYQTVSERTAGLPSLSNADASDGRFTFTPAAGNAYANLDIGLVETPALDDDNTAGIQPGQTVSLAHRYRATTTASVAFTYADVTMNPAQGFSAALFEDTGCDGTPDVAVTAAMSVTAGQIVCLVSRIGASSGVGPGAQLGYRLVATSTLSVIGRVLEADDTDMVRVGGTGDTLVLRKTVRNITQGGTEGTANLGDIGDVLEYRILMRNPGVTTVSDVTVSDRTPLYTALSEAVPSPVVVAPGVECALVTPAVNSAGYTGSLRWTCSGTFVPGQEGSVSFRVAIQP